MKKAIASFGSISSGTMRSCDLVDAFESELRALRGSVPADIYQDIRAFRAAESRDEQYEFDGELVESLFDALNEFAPAYGYFGAHPGDGADYGFWLSEEWEQNAKDDGALFVDDTSEVPADYLGEVVHVSDHGNATLYSARKGALVEVWSIV